MAQSQFSLLWDSHKKNICNGLSALQQNGEFVDMTLAADGHLVKVHQVIIALASPYIKELISSAQCPHPVIFLNKISYSTLCSLLEYVYTGEVLVSVENLNELIQAGKELHIKGLEDMKLSDALSVKANILSKPESIQEHNLQRYEEDEVCYFEITNPNDESKYVPDEINNPEQLILGTNPDHNYDTNEDEPMHETTSRPLNVTKVSNSNECSPNTSTLQYTVSNRGSLQMILNRYIYYLKHSNLNNTRQWRCVDYLNNTKCPALVVTKNDAVIQRMQAHIHPFHDKKILNKVKEGAIYTAIHEAEEKTWRGSKND